MRLWAVSAIICGVALGACSPGAERVAPATDSSVRLAGVTPAKGFTPLYFFKGRPDGVAPYGPLLFFEGAFYGTTANGGKRNDGTVFTLTLSGQEHVLHSFGEGADGGTPYGGLVAVKGTLYGTTQRGGTLGDGTVFSITRSGTEKVIHSFAGSDGAEPHAGLVTVGGALYGTTAAGGPGEQDGTVFKVELSGKEKVLHNFGASKEDGKVPNSSLTVFHGALYGVTTNGGSAGSACTYGCGTVFKVDLAGNESVVYSFRGSGAGDGAFPFGSLVVFHGALCGTTTVGGYYNQGIVFTVTPSGEESAFHNFAGGSDGAYPYDGPIEAAGALYGTTVQGGARGDGTIFELTAFRQERTLHGFVGSDGSSPFASLTNVGGVLYGAASSGGKTNSGAILKIAP